MTPEELKHEVRNRVAAAMAAVELLAGSRAAGHPALFALQRQLGALAELVHGTPGDEPATAPHTPIRVLVIEDNADLATTYRAMLESRGDAVTTVNTGRAALAAAQEATFDLILCDIGLPDMDGRELAGQLSTRGAKLVAVSGYDQPADRARSLAAGFDAHLTKPISLADVDQVVHNG